MQGAQLTKWAEEGRKQKEWSPREWALSVSEQELCFLLWMKWEAEAWHTGLPSKQNHSSHCAEKRLKVSGF